MTGRPRTISDLDILKGAASVVAEKPDSWTLADVGDVAGVSPAGLVQRFGSKRELETRVVEFLNDRDLERHRDAVGDLVVVTCHGDRQLAGLFVFRMLAALRGDRTLREAAMGSGI